MPQTSYDLDLARATAGQIVERYPGGMRGKYEASETLEVGRLCELHSDGKLRAPQGTTLTKLVGAVPYIATKQTAPWGTSDGPVPVLKKGQMWVEYAGTAPSAEAAVNVMHSSTTAANRGKVTASSTSVSAGSEISAVEGLRCLDVDTSLGLALVEFNLPA